MQEYMPKLDVLQGLSRVIGLLKDVAGGVDSHLSSTQQCELR